MSASATGRDAGTAGIDRTRRVVTAIGGGLLALAVFCGFTIVAGAAPKAGPKIRSTLFVALKASERVLMIDTDRDEVVGALPVGLVPNDMVVSDTAGRIAVTDGRSLHSVDVPSGRLDRIADAGPIGRLLVQPEGPILAAVAVDGRSIGLFDLRDGAQRGRVAFAAPVRDAVFARDGSRLVVSVEGEPELSIVDVAAPTEPRRLAGLSPEGRAFARAPNGRDLFARIGDSGIIDAIDLRKSVVAGRLTVGEGVRDIFVSGTGRLLILPDVRRGRLLLASTEPLAVTADLPGTTDVVDVFSSWFDLAAFAVSATDNAVLVYDLDAGAAAGRLRLPGRPGRGAIDAEGTKIYLPLLDRAEITLVSARDRTIAGAIRLPAPAVAIALVGGYGVCH